MTLRPKPFTVPMPLGEEVRIIRERDPANSPVNGHRVLTAGRFETLLLTRLEDRARVPQVLVESDFGDGFHNQNIPFSSGAAALDAGDLSMQMDIQGDAFRGRLATNRPALVVTGSTYHTVMRDAQREQGKNFQVPSLPQLTIALRRLGGGKVWETGLGAECEHIQRESRRWSTFFGDEPRNGLAPAFFARGKLSVKN